ncbi:hypothetical protein AB9T88_13025 [Flavobacterium sp. LBUM151]
MENNTLPQGESQTSKLDLLTGKHTKDLIIFLLVIAILLTILFSKAPEKITDRLLDALLALVGFFAGSKINTD